MNDKTFFAQVCKLTCLGGSEKGTCDCTSPHECKGRDRPGFKQARREAIERMQRFLRTPPSFPTSVEKLVSECLGNAVLSLLIQDRAKKGVCVYCSSQLERPFPELEKSLGQAILKCPVCQIAIHLSLDEAPEN